MKKVLFQVKASKLITLKCCRGIFKFWMKYYKDGGSGGRSSRSLKRCKISIRSNCYPAGIASQNFTLNLWFLSVIPHPAPQVPFCGVIWEKKDFQTACCSKLKLRSEMFESFKNWCANLHQLCQLPTKHPCQLQKSQTHQIHKYKFKYKNKYKYRYKYKLAQLDIKNPCELQKSQTQSFWDLLQRFVVYGVLLNYL